jgi:hypothetical protein
MDSALGSRPIATIDLTGRCPLRCRHCYFFAAPALGPDLADQEFLARAAQLRDEWGIQSVFWIGGEPLLRESLLRKAMALFDRNCVSTSGYLPIPANLPAGLLVSLDGPEALHDRLRGLGSFQRVLRHTAVLPSGTWVISLTLTAATIEAVPHLPALLAQTTALGIVVGFHVGPAGDPLRIDGAAREEAVDTLLALHESAPGVLLNTPASLEWFRPQRLSVPRIPCMYADRALAFDVRLEIKPPCTFGAVAACDTCGCPMVAAQRAIQEGDAASRALLRRAFPTHSSAQ